MENEEFLKSILIGLETLFIFLKKKLIKEKILIKV